MTSSRLFAALLCALALPGPASADIVSYWSFDADASDATGLHDGTLVNGAVISTGGQGFGDGEALSLAGGNGLAGAQYVTTANPTGFDFDTDFTWHAYIQTTDTGTGIFGRAPAASAHNQGSKSLFLGGANVQWDTGWVGAPGTGVPANDGNWHQVIVTFIAASDQLDIFVDPSVGATTGQYSGVHDVNKFDESTPHNGGVAESAFFIGLVSDNFRNKGWNGLIDEAAVFDTALSGWELDQLITNGPASFISGDDPNLVAPPSVDLAASSVPAGAVSRSVSVSNASGSTMDLAISGVTFTGGDSALFTNPVLPGALSPNASGDISFTFTPTTTGSFTTTMQVASDDPSSPEDIVLNIEVANDPLLAAPSTVKEATTGSGPFTALISISNSGLTQTLNISSVTPTGGDATRFTVDAFPATIGPGQGGNIEVTFTPPGASRTYSTDLVIVSDSVGGSPSTIGLELAVFTLQASSLVAYWPFDTSNGSVTPDITGLHDGTLVNGAVISTGGQGFGGGEALSLAGGNGLAGAQYVTTANPTGFDFDTDFTWHAYIQTTDTGTGIFGRAPAASAHNQGSKSLFLGGANVQWDTGWVGAPGTGVPANDGNWHQVIVTFIAASDQLDIFVDPSVGATTGQYSGVHDVNKFDESTPHNGGVAESAFFIGLVSDNFRNKGWNGLIDEAAVFDTALSGWELDQLITDGPASFVTTGPPAAAIRLVIIPAAAGSYDLEWDSRDGMLYNLRSNADLTGAIPTWTLVEGDIPASGTGTNVRNVVPAGTTRFYAVEEFPPPPVTLFEQDFDGTLAGSLPAGWSTGKNDPPDTTSLTSWELGTPSAVGPVPPGVPLPSGSQCIATNISGNYDDPVSNVGNPYTDSWLRSPAIDLGAATEGTLTFQQWTQIEDVPGDLDYGSIRILDASDDSLLAVVENRTIDGNTSGWEEYSMALPAAAFTATAGTIKVEWKFEADDIDSFAGWYIDNVAMTTPGS